MTGRRRAALWGFVAFVLVAAGAGAGFAIGTAQAPEQLATATPPKDFPVVVEQFLDLRRVRVQLTRGEPASLNLTGQGRLTKSACAPGAPIESGTTTWSIEGEPVLSLYTSEPMHRDLAADAKGGDVAAVQAELVRLGYDLTANGVFGSATERALDELRANLGISKADGLAMDQVIWLPAPQVWPESCAALGAVLQVGDKIATSQTPLLGAQIKPVPELLTPGERTLTIGATTVTVTAEGKVPAEELVALWQEPLVVAALASPNEEALLIETRLELATPVDGVSVPASAILTSGGTCVVSGDERILPVEVLSSAVGQSIISFAGGEPPQSVQIDPDRARSCG